MTEPASLLFEIEALYRDRFEPFRRLAFVIVRDRELAVEMVQETFAAALAGRDRYRGEGPLDAWVCRILVSTARKRLRERPAVELTGEPVAGCEDR